MPDPNEKTEGTTTATDTNNANNEIAEVKKEVTTLTSTIKDFFTSFTKKAEEEAKQAEELKAAAPPPPPANETELQRLKRENEELRKQNEIALAKQAEQEKLIKEVKETQEKLLKEQETKKIEKAIKLAKEIGYIKTDDTKAIETLTKHLLVDYDGTVAIIKQHKKEDTTEAPTFKDEKERQTMTQKVARMAVYGY